MSKHILVVDDVKEAADTKILVIEHFGKGEFTAEAVYGGRECLDRLSKTPKVDLILLDMDMPEVNGADVIRALLKMENPPAPILPMTAWGPTWEQHWGLTDLRSAPYYDWVWNEAFDKATDPEDLMELIRRVFGKSR